ncbi:MAG TPA: hypothetical protein VHH88_00745, partial [Verrucomicrobiae bacterium]|nr:hypothetical protein [Verrucomicrobiae bacterium]
MFSSFKTRPTAQLLPAASLFTFSLLLLAPLCRGSGFELRDGDRVALIGDTLIEREQAWGQLET